MSVALLLTEARGIFQVSPANAPPLKKKIIKQGIWNLYFIYVKVGHVIDDLHENAPISGIVFYLKPPATSRSPEKSEYHDGQRRLVYGKVY